MLIVPRLSDEYFLDYVGGFLCGEIFGIISYVFCEGGPIIEMYGIYGFVEWVVYYAFGYYYGFVAFAIRTGRLVACDASLSYEVDVKAVGYER